MRTGSGDGLLRLGRKNHPISTKFNSLLSFGHSGYASANHMTGKLFNLMAKTRIKHVPYKAAPTTSSPRRQAKPS